MSSPDPRPLVAVSLRLDHAPGHGEDRDGLARDWSACFDRWGVTPILVPNRDDGDVSWLRELGVDAVLLTGGNTPGADGVDADDVAPARDTTETALVDFALRRDLPVLGVCRGAQFLAVRFGARLGPVDRDVHVATRHEVAWSSGRHTHRSTVNSFHAWAIEADGFPAELRIRATADDGTVEAFEHVDRPILGVMWHPERDGIDDPVLREVVDGFLRGAEVA